MARKAKMTKDEAHAHLKSRGLDLAYMVYAVVGDNDKREEEIIRDIVGKLIWYGSISDKAEDFLRTLVHKIEHRDEIEAERKAEWDAAKEIPAFNGRATVRGEIIHTKYDDRWDNMKMLLRHRDGWKLWGTIPRAISNAEVGDEVEFVATITRSNDDPKFGFASRPAKARIVRTAEKAAA